MGNQLTAVTDDAFQSDVIDADLPVLVDFWAEWCGPCKALTPILEDVSQGYQGKLKFLKLNVDQNPSSAQKFGIRGIPTIMIFKDGQAVGTHTGLLNKSELVKFIEGSI